MSNIVRVFRAITKEGKEEEFQTFFTNDAVSLVQGFEGLVSVTVGLPDAENPQEFLMITTWKDVESLKELTGENWKEAIIDPREAPLLQQVFVHHYREAKL